MEHFTQGPFPYDGQRRSWLTINDPRKRIDEEF
jgi:hypothetical protein